MINDLEKTKIAIIGLGYVGLPLAIEFGKKFQTIGFDIDQNRINELHDNHDRTNEVSSDELSEKADLKFTSNPEELSSSNVYVITVPTPIDEKNNPDFGYLIEASKSVGAILSDGNIVIYESTVYPGATEEVCVPVLEDVSKFKMNDQFHVGYSPERINPGDKSRGVSDIIKVTSGSNKDAADFIDLLYGSIINAGTHKAPSIKVAEAAKVIENTQRDLNIALINELSILFNKLEIDTTDVLEAAKTKWNFLPFESGIVGGHCIGVDPYYLTYKAKSIGFSPEIILAGRNLNDGMSDYISDQMLSLMDEKKIQHDGSRVLILGFSFKENCPDHRNTKVLDIYQKLKQRNIHADIYDPWPDATLVQKEYDLDLLEYPKKEHYDGIVLAVKHKEFIDMGIEKINEFRKTKSVLMDLKSVFKKELSDFRL